MWEKIKPKLGERLQPNHNNQETIPRQPRSPYHSPSAMSFPSPSNPSGFYPSHSSTSTTTINTHAPSQHSQTSSHRSSPSVSALKVLIPIRGIFSKFPSSGSGASSPGNGTNLPLNHQARSISEEMHITDSRNVSRSASRTSVSDSRSGTPAGSASASASLAADYLRERGRTERWEGFESDNEPVRRQRSPLLRKASFGGSKRRGKSSLNRFKSKKWQDGSPGGPDFQAPGQEEFVNRAQSSSSSRCHSRQGSTFSITTSTSTSRNDLDDCRCSFSDDEVDYANVGTRNHGRASSGGRTSRTESLGRVTPSSSKTSPTTTRSVSSSSIQNDDSRRSRWTREGKKASGIGLGLGIGSRGSRTTPTASSGPPPSSMASFEFSSRGSSSRSSGSLSLAGSGRSGPYSNHLPPRSMSNTSATSSPRSLPQSSFDQAAQARADLWAVCGIRSAEPPQEDIGSVTEEPIECYEQNSSSFYSSSASSSSPAMIKFKPSDFWKASTPPLPEIPKSNTMGLSELDKRRVVGPSTTTSPYSPRSDKTSEESTSTSRGCITTNLSSVSAPSSSSTLSSKMVPVLSIQSSSFEHNRDPDSDDLAPPTSSSSPYHSAATSPLTDSPPSGGALPTAAITTPKSKRMSSDIPPSSLDRTIRALPLRPERSDSTVVRFAGNEQQKDNSERRGGRGPNPQSSPTPTPRVRKSSLAHHYKETSNHPSSSSSRSPVIQPALSTSSVSVSSSYSSPPLVQPQPRPHDVSHGRSKSKRRAFVAANFG